MSRTSGLRQDPPRRRRSAHASRARVCVCVRCAVAGTCWNAHCLIVRGHRVARVRRGLDDPACVRRARAVCQRAAWIMKEHVRFPRLAPAPRRCWRCVGASRHGPLCVNEGSCIRKKLTLHQYRARIVRPGRSSSVPGSLRLGRSRRCGCAEESCSRAARRAWSARARSARTRAAALVGARGLLQERMSRPTSRRRVLLRPSRAARTSRTPRRARARPTARPRHASRA